MSISNDCVVISDIQKQINRLEEDQATAITRIMAKYEALFKKISAEVKRVEREYNLSYRFINPYLGSIVSEYTTGIYISDDHVLIQWADNSRYDPDEGSIRIPLIVFDGGSLDYIEQTTIDYLNEQAKSKEDSQLREYLKLKEKFEGHSVK